MSSIFKRAVHFVEVDPLEDGSRPTFLVNHDLLPVPIEERKWGVVNFVTFWVADSANVSTFMIASSMVGAGMSWWQAWLAVWVGYGLSAVFLVLNAYPGARYHIIFPAYARASFGVYGACWPTLNRAFCAIIWYGVQAWIGGEATYVLLRSIWPSFTEIKNTIPSSGTDTAHFVSFFLFSFFSLFLIYPKLHTIRHLFTVKAIITPAAAIGLLAWSLVKAHGAGELLSAPSTLAAGSALGWTFMAQMMGCIANMATLITNAVDFASRADKPSSVVTPQLIAMPMTFAVTSLVGILIGSASVAIFGEFVWSPIDVMNGFLDRSQSHGTRAGCAFIAIGFIVAQVGTNISANSISAGCDTTALCPRFLTIRRGGYLAALVGFCICPWNLASGANAFGNYLSAYSVFLSSIAGVLITHYYLVAGRKIRIVDLYTNSHEGIYRYKGGFNLRAFAAYLSGVAINITGFVGAVAGPVPLAATRIYQLSFFTGFLASGLVYFVLCKIFPIPIAIEEDHIEESHMPNGFGSSSLKHYSSYDDDKKASDEIDAVRPAGNFV